MQPLDDAEFVLPQRPFFDCNDAGLAVFDSEELKRGLTSGEIPPGLSLRLGEDNIIERRPRRAVRQGDGLVVVDCDGNVTVYLDFEDGAARKRTPEGTFLYRGGIDEGNDAKGYIRAL